MAYTPEHRVTRMKELMKPIDSQIMMCDDVQDLLALASIMTVSAKTIYTQQLGHDAARELFKIVMESIPNER